MITFDEVLALGWVDRHPRSKRVKEISLGPCTFMFGCLGDDHHIMSIHKYSEDEDLFTTSINYVPANVKSNEWGNSETHFYGFIRDKVDLECVMQLIEVIELKSKIILV